jgi:hypothetical protein
VAHTCNPSYREAEEGGTKSKANSRQKHKVLLEKITKAKKGAWLK